MMTLVAFFSPEKPVILADVLLSHATMPQLQTLPNGVSLAPMPVGQLRPVDTTQKIVLLADGQIALAGTGDISTIKMIAQRLASEFPNLKPLDLPKWLGERAALCGSNTNIIAAWFDRKSGDYCTAGVGEDIKKFTAKEFGTVFASGSGRPWLEKFFVRPGKTVQSTNNFTFQEKVKMLAVAQTGLHLSFERLFGVKDHFGGGFQIAAFNGEKFEFVSDITYLAFHVSHGSDGSAQVMLAPMINFQRCHGGVLAFDVWSLSNGQSETRTGVTVFRAKASRNRNLVKPLINGVANNISPVDEFRTPEYVSITIIHYSDTGDMLYHKSFQMFGDPNCNPIQMTISDDDIIEVSIEESTLDAWLQLG